MNTRYKGEVVMLLMGQQINKDQLNELFVKMKKPAIVDYAELEAYVNSLTRSNSFDELVKVKAELKANKEELQISRDTLEAVNALQIIKRFIKGDKM